MAATSALSVGTVESAGYRQVSRSEILDLLSVVSLPSSDTSTVTQSSHSSSDSSQPSTGENECTQKRKKNKKRKSFRWSISNKVLQSGAAAKEKQKTFLRKLSSRKTSFHFKISTKSKTIEDLNASLAVGSLDARTSDITRSCRSTSLVSIPETEPLHEPLPKVVKIERRKRFSRSLSKLFSSHSRSSKVVGKWREEEPTSPTKKRKSLSKSLSKLFSSKSISKKWSNDDEIVETAVVPRVQAISGTVSFSKLAGTMPARVPKAIAISMPEESTKPESAIALAPCESPPSVQKKVFNYKRKSPQPVVIDLPKSILKGFAHELGDLPLLIEADADPVPVPTRKTAAAPTKKQRYLRRNPVHNLLILGFFLLATYMMSSNTSIINLQPKIQPSPPRRNSNDRFLVFSDMYASYHA
jgi:hypothetical protein